MEQFKAKTVAICPFCRSMYKVAIDLAGKMVRCSKCKQKFSVKNDIETSVKENVDSSLLFCKIALNYGYISESQLETVLIEQTRLAQKGINQDFQEIFLRRGILSSETTSIINDILPKWGLRQLEKKYAALAVKKGLIQADKAKEVLINQAKHFSKTGTVKTVGEYLVESGDITSLQDKEISYDNSANSNKNNDYPELNIKPPTPAKQIAHELKPESKSKSQETIAEIDKIRPDKGPDASKVKPTLKTKQAVNLVSGNLFNSSLIQPVVPSPENKSFELDNKTSEPEIKDIQAAQLLPEEMNSYTEELNENDQEQIIKKINGMELIITADLTIAFLRASDDIPPNTSVESIKQILADESITFGIVDDSLIKGFLNSRVFREKPLRIAEGKVAKKGVKGSVKYHFDTEHLKVGAVSETGEIDFRDRGEIPYVKKGTLLAEITPAIIGENGVDIYGNIIAVPLIQHVKLRCEAGTEFSEDGLKVFAENDGQPKLTIGDRLYVLSELTIPGDVGFETGHIEFDGNINILGTIQSDFTVKGANITATEILEAKIIATGDISVTDGIKGATIKTEGNVKAKFIHKGNIKAFGNVIVEKEIIDSKIKNSGGCQVTRGKIIASEISSKQGIEAVSIGTEMSEPSKLKIGVDDHINSEIEIIENQIKQKKDYALELRNNIESFNDKDKKIHLIIADFAHLQDRSQLEVKSLQKSINELDLLKNDGKNDEIALMEKQIETLSEKIRVADEDVNKQFDIQDQITENITECKKLLSSCEDELDILQHEKQSLIDWIQKQKTIAYIKTSGPMYHGTIIIGSHSSKVIKETIRHANIREVKNPATIEGWEIKVG